MLTVENLVSPQHHDHLIITHIGDVVAPAGDCLDDFRLLTISEQLIKIARYDMAKTKTGLAFDDQKLLGLGVVVMSATGDTRMSGKVGELPGIARTSVENGRNPSVL